ncbi:radical SAM family heme chaperone HemW [Bacteroidota bacterium]
MAGIYIHIPFCRKKCFYCDFFSIESLNLFTGYIDALLLEIDIRLKHQNYEFPEISTVFFGGGTPSLLYTKMLEKIITKLEKSFNIKSDAEWSLEANPETLNLELLKEYKSLGFNRLSIGIQSFVDTELQFLQRIHNSSKAEDSIKSARKAGFDNINIDLIFSIPGQTLESLDITLKKTKELSPEHISAYSLIYEPGTPLYESYTRNEIEKTDDDIDAMYYELIATDLIENGYEHYEVSNFSKPGKKCFHNLNYWESGNYLAFGPSAHGFVNRERYWNANSLEIYFKNIQEGKLPLAGSEKLTKENRVNEKIMLGLRSGGIKFNEFKQEFEIDILDLAKDIFYKWESLKLCNSDDNCIKLNYQGYSICNELTMQLIKRIEKK